MELLDDFIQDRKAQLWALAANHVDSSDLKYGADFFGVTRELHRLEQQAETDLWPATITVATGGQWPRERQFAACYSCSRLCKRCGKAPETAYRRAWSCEKNQGHEDFERFQSRIPRAAAPREAEPSYWLRGVPASALTRPPFEEREVLDNGFYTFGDPSELLRAPDSLLEIFGGGSGGLCS
eukprot:5904660-Pyramimonas_sp.AAC.1